MDPKMQEPSNTQGEPQTHVQVSARYSDEEMLRFQSQANELLEQDGDYQRMMMAMIAARRLYALAAGGLDRFVEVEQLEPKFADYSIDAMKLQAERPFEVERLVRQVDAFLMPFLHDEVSRNQSEEETARIMSSSLNNVLFLKRAIGAKEIAKGTALLLVGTPKRVMAEIHELFPQGAQPNVLLSGGITTLMTSDVMFLTHELTAPGRFMPYERWSDTLASPRNWGDLMQSIRRELKRTPRLVVCTNLNLALSPRVLNAQKRLLRDGLRTLGLTAQSQGIPVLAGISAQHEQLKATVELVRTNAVRVNNIVVEELS